MQGIIDHLQEWCSVNSHLGSEQHSLNVRALAVCLQGGIFSSKA